MASRFILFPGVSICVLVALFASGCGGGGGGSASSAGQALTAAYFPDAQQNAWVYDGTSSVTSGPFFDSISVTGTKSVLGRSTTIFLENNPEGSGTPVEDYYFKDTRAFTFFGNNDVTDWLDRALVPYDEMVFGVPLSNLTLFSKTGVNIATDLDSDGISETIDARAVLNFDKFEPLATAAGSFSSAAKVTGTINVTLHLSKGGTLPSVTTWTQWRALNSGLLKEIITVNVNGTVATDTLDIHGFRVDGKGVGYLAPQTLVSGVATASSDSMNPGRNAVGTDSSDFLLVSRQQTNIPNVSAISKWTGRLILADGTVQTPFDLSPADSNSAGEAAIAFDGSNYLALTNTNIGPSGISGITGQRVSAAGNVIDAAPGITIAPDGFHPAIAFGGGVYLIVYVKPADGSKVFGRLVLPTGIVGAEFAIHTGTGSDSQSNPSVAFDGSNFLVAWERSLGTPDTADILGVHLTTTGTAPNGTFPVSTAVEAQNYPQVACDGTNCLVVWTDRRNYPGQPYNVSPGPGDMYGTRISSNDGLLDGAAATGGLPIATGITANAGYPALAFSATEYIVAWSRGAYVNNPGGPTGIYAGRVGTNGTVILGPAPTGVAVSGPPDAASRLYFVSMAGSPNGTLATWLNDVETSGTTKSIGGALMYPLASQ